MGDTPAGGHLSRRRLLQAVGTGVATQAVGVGMAAAADGGDGQGGDGDDGGKDLYNVGVRAGHEDAGVPAVKEAADSVRTVIDLGDEGTVVNGTFPAAAREALEDNPHVEFVELDPPRFKSQETLPWGIDRIGADQLYTADTVGTPDDATVAVLDTGVDDDHPDLQNISITGDTFGATCGGRQGSNCPNNPNDSEGYNNNPCNFSWSDDDDHGTHVTGTIAADDDGDGVRGITPGIDILAGKVLDGCGLGSASDIAKGIEWATNQGADVINMSLGGPGSDAEMTACRYAHRSNVVVVAAAGNAGFCRDCVDAPARYSTVIGVSNVANPRGGLYFSSSTGPEVELAAPGSAILSTIPPESESDANDGYAHFWGTSMASPHVAGTAAIVKDLTPLGDNEAIRARLRTSAENISLDADDQGYGLLDAAEATDSVLRDTSPDRPQVVAETDTLAITDDWFPIFLGGQFSDPVVVAGPPTLEGGDPTTVRVRPDTDLFTLEEWEITLQEWDYLGGSHPTEEVSVAVFESGHHTALNGQQAEAGHVFEVTTSWQSVAFEEPFPQDTNPVVIPQCVTFNGADPVTVRVRNVDETGFEVKLQEEEANGWHTAEQVDYLAVEPHSMVDSGFDSTAAHTFDNVTDTGTSVSLSGFDERPEVFAQILTYDGGNTCNLRVDNWDASGFDVYVDEEQSADAETSHTTENVGYVALEQFETAALTNQTGTGTTTQPDAGTWHPVSAESGKFFEDPVVVMGPPTDNGGHPMTVRVRNVGTDPAGRTTFEFQFDEWDYLDGSHRAETVSYGIFEAGTGSIGSAYVEAGYVVDVDDNWESVFFEDFEIFDGPPVVITQCTTQGGDDPVTVRTRNVDEFGFEVRLQEEEAKGNHITERVDYLAVEPVAESTIEAGTTGDNVDEKPNINNAFGGFSTAPDFFASMQTTDGGNTASLRATEWDDTGFGVFVDEEESADSETGHANENVGYVGLAHTEPGQIDREVNTVTENQPDAGHWHDVSTGVFSHPIVVMGAPTFNGSQPMTVRVRNQHIDGFQFQFDEWSYLNGSHVEESISYGVFEAGRGTLDAGGESVAEAGSLAVDEHWQEERFSYDTPFSSAPVVIAQVASHKGFDPVTVRVRNVTTEGFEARLQEEEALGGHAWERVDYIAAEPVDTDNLTVGRTGDVVNHNETSVSLSGFSSRPHVLAQIQTFDGADPCNLRLSNVTSSGFDVEVDEENSVDGEGHTDENVGYIAFD